MKTNQNLVAALFGLLASVPLIGQPTITTQPADQSVSLGATVRFRVAAVTSGGTATCRWWFKDAALNPALNPSSATSTLVLTNTTAAMAGPYWAVLSDDNGSATSETAQLVVDRTFRKVTEGVVVTDKESSTSATWCDYDRDGLLDLLVGNFWWPNPQRLSLYHNEGGGIFTKVTNAITAASNVTLDEIWGDFDNDGDPDLFVSRPERKNNLFRNDGQGVFVAVTNTVTPANGRHLGAAWTDLDRDGWLDVFVSTYNLNGDGTDQDNDLVFRNTGTAFVSLAADAVGVLVTDATDTAYPSWCDFDNDGDADLYLGGRSSAFLYRNDGNGQFESIGLGSVPPSGPSLGGCWADVNNDGLFDLYVFGTGGLPLTLHLNRAGQTFEDVTDAAGLGLSGSVWGPAFGDYDNDGDLDLFVPDYSSRNTLFANNGDGTFRSIEVGGPLIDGLQDEAASWADYDNDGFLDLFVPCGEGNPSPNLLYHNNLPLDGNTNRWLKIRVEGTVSNRQGIGAKVQVRSSIHGRNTWQTRQIASNSSMVTGPEFIAHFGLGDATQAETIRIEWPSGIVQELANVPANQILTVTEPSRLQSLGASRVRIQCWKGQKFEAEVSNDLLAWTSLGVFTNETGTLEFTDPAAGQQAWRFYRAVSR